MQDSQDSQDTQDLQDSKDSQDSVGSESPTPRYSMAAIMLVIAMVMIGTSIGLLVANRDQATVLIKEMTGKSAPPATGQVISLTPDTKPDIAASEESEAEGSQGEQASGEPASKVIRTGFPSISAVRYSPRADSVHLDFDLEGVEVIGTGELSSPDRIFLDLQNSREKGTSGQSETQEAFSINGDLIAKVRIAQRESGAMRIVLDLKRSCDFTYQILPDSPSRLVVELRPRAGHAVASRTTKPKPVAKKPIAHDWVVSQYPSQ